MTAAQRPPQCVVCFRPVWECSCGKPLVQLERPPAVERPDYRSLKDVGREYRDLMVQMDQARVKPLPSIHGSLDAPSASFEYESATRQRVRENIVAAWWGNEAALAKVDEFVEGGRRPNGKIMSHVDYRMASFADFRFGQPQWLSEEINHAAKLARKRKRAAGCPAKRSSTFAPSGTATCR